MIRFALWKYSYTFALKKQSQYTTVFSVHLINML